MRWIVFLCCGGILLFAFTLKEKQSSLPTIKHSSFIKGEVLNYRVNFGIFTVGNATTRIDNKIFTINSRPAYKVDALGETSGLVSWITKVNDVWGAYIDTSALVTHISYRKIREGRYKKDELITFDHENNTAEVKVMDQESGIYKEVKEYQTPSNVRDLVGGFLFLRVIAFEKYKKGDTLSISGFFEDTSYNLKILYDGKEVIKTSFGKVPCYRLIPIMPDNKLFDGENSITCWISEDKNKIPVKIQAKMFIGSTGIELINFSGLRNQFKIIY